MKGKKMSNEDILTGELQRAQIHPHQKSLHFAKNEQDIENLLSDFWKDTLKISWNGNISRKMQEHPIKNSVQFDCDSDHYHNLLYVKVKQQFPSISVKDKDNIRIAYKDHPAIRSIETTSLLINNDEFVMDQTTLYMMFQYFRKKNKDVSRILGNVSSMTNFSHTLPKYETDLHLPWSYTKHTSLSLPLYRNISVTHKIKLVDSFSSLLKMQKKSNNNIWEEIPFNWEYIMDEVGLELPSMIARYSRLQNDEIESLECESIISYIMEKVIPNQSPNSFPYDGKVIEIDLFQGSPCKAILFLIEDEKGNIVNSQGEPWHEHYSILYGTEKRVSEHTETDDESEAYQHFISQSNVRGISPYSFILDQKELPPTVSIMFQSQTKLSIKLKKGKTDEEMKTQLRVKIRLLTEHHLSFQKKNKKVI